MTHTTESMMALADAYADLTGGMQNDFADAREVDTAKEALKSAITELVDQLDIQAGSIEAVQAANVRLAAERDMLDQLNDSLKSDVQRAYKDRDALHASWEAHFGARSFGEVLTERDALHKDAARLKSIAWIIGSIYVHGNFIAETANERELERLLRENGTFWETLTDFDAAMKGPTP